MAEQSPAPQEVKPVETILADIVPETKPKDDQVPLAKYMEEKKARQELERALAAKDAAGDGLSKAELKELAEKHDASPELLEALERRRLASEKGLKDDVATQVAEALRNLMPELESVKNANSIREFNEKFGKVWDKALEVAPEYADIADKDTMKYLATLPENKALTMTQILEKTYGKAIQGRKTLESARPSGKDDAGADVNFGNPSDEDWKRIQENPELKKKYEEVRMKAIERLL